MKKAAIFFSLQLGKKSSITGVKVGYESEVKAVAELWYAEMEELGHSPALSNDCTFYDAHGNMFWVEIHDVEEVNYG